MESENLTATVIPPSPDGGGPLHYQQSPGSYPNAGRSIKQHFNTFVAKDLTEAQLWEIVQNRCWGLGKRLAAKRLLRAFQDGDFADFEPFLTGASLESLRAKGVDTSLVKSVSITPGVHGEARRIELHDRSTQAFRDIMDYTDGKPNQAVNVNGQVQIQAVVVKIDGIQPPADFNLPASDSIVPLPGVNS